VVGALSIIVITLNGRASSREGWLTESLAFSPDGKTLAACQGPEGEPNGLHGIVLWDIDPESWVRRAGMIANRNFADEEWRQYFLAEDYRTTFPDLPVPSK
jgi:hypothetical protein